MAECDPYEWGASPVVICNSGRRNQPILEVECGENIYCDPQATVETLKKNYGYAGKDFVDVIKDMDPAELREMQRRIQSEIHDDEKMQKQSISLLIILTADRIATDYLFKDGQYLSIEEAKAVLVDRGSFPTMSAATSMC